MGILSKLKGKSTKEEAGELIKHFKAQLNLKPNHELRQVLQGTPAIPQGGYEYPIQSMPPSPYGYNPQRNIFMEHVQVMKTIEDMKDLARRSDERAVEKNRELIEEAKDLVAEELQNEMGVEPSMSDKMLEVLGPILMEKFAPKLAGGESPPETEDKPLMYTADGKPYDPYKPPVDTPKSDTTKASSSGLPPSVVVSEKDIRDKWKKVPLPFRNMAKSIVKKGGLTPEETAKAMKMIQEGEL